MKKLYIYFTLVAFTMFGCKDGYIDDISSVDPGADESNPAVAITFPTGNITIPFTQSETDVEFKFNVSDDIEVGSIELSLNGTQLESYSDFKDYRKANLTYMYEALPVGDYSLVVTATDLSGKETSKTVNFEVTNEYVAQAGEIFYMPFEGMENRDLISENLATTGGDPGFVEGASGDASSLDVADKSYLLFPGDLFADVTSFSVSFWMKPEFVDEDDNGSHDGAVGIFGLSNTEKFWGNIDIFIDGGNSEGATVKSHITNDDSETWITMGNIADLFGNWSHHVLTYDNETREFKYYINSELINTTTASWTDEFAFTSSGSMVFGTLQFMTDPSLTSATTAQDWGSYFNGEMDEVRIFNKSLTTGEVETLYGE